MARRMVLARILKHNEQTIPVNSKATCYKWFSMEPRATLTEKVRSEDEVKNDNELEIYSGVGSIPLCME